MSNRTDDRNHHRHSFGMTRWTVIDHTTCNIRNLKSARPPNANKPLKQNFMNRTEPKHNTMRLLM